MKKFLVAIQELQKVTSNAVFFPEMVFYFPKSLNIDCQVIKYLYCHSDNEYDESINELIISDAYSFGWLVM